MENNARLIISLYDYTLNWVQPYIKAKYPVLPWDKKIEGDLLHNFSRLLIAIETAMEEYPGLQLYGILAAPPCTVFTKSSNRFWSDRYDAINPDYYPFESFTELSVALVEIVLHMVDLFKPKFWVLENPEGRLERLVPALKPFRRMSFNPCEFGDTYTKKTVLWGEFNEHLIKDYVLPLDGSKMANVAPGPDRQAIRSATPKGFSNAFFQANR